MLLDISLIYYDKDFSMNLSKVIEQTMTFRETLANEECLSTSTQDKQSFITMGIVYVFNGKCFSWSRYLKPAQEYCPGVIAISIEGKCCQAIGGNEQDGANEWLLLHAN